jgi:hypothetical protein
MENPLNQWTLVSLTQDPDSGSVHEEWDYPNFGWVFMHVAPDGRVLDASVDFGEDELELEGPWPTREEAWRALEDALNQTWEAA